MLLGVMTKLMRKKFLWNEFNVLFCFVTFSRIYSMPESFHENYRQRVKRKRGTTTIKINLNVSKQCQYLSISVWVNVQTERSINFWHFSFALLVWSDVWVAFLKCKRHKRNNNWIEKLTQRWRKQKHQRQKKNNNFYLKGEFIHKLSTTRFLSQFVYIYFVYLHHLFVLIWCVD